MTCKHCGAPLTEGAKFCVNCGNKIEEAVVETVAESVNETVEEAADSYKEPERVEADVVEEAPKAETYEEPASSVNTGSDSEQGPMGYSIASLVCGILGLLCCCCGFFGIALSIAGIVLGIVSLKKNCEGKGMAIAGIVCGGIGALSGLVGVIAGASTSSLMNNIGDIDSINGLDDISDFLDSL